MKLRVIESNNGVNEDFPLQGSRTRSGRGQYTMKIVLTMTVEAPSREQAESLASHVAAFMPEDAVRIADAFAPVIMVSRSNNGIGNADREGQAAAEAAVVLVSGGDATVTATGKPGLMLSVSENSPVHARPERQSVRSNVRSAPRQSLLATGGGRSSVYTRSSV
jgi:hypothetical protein